MVVLDDHGAVECGIRGVVYGQGKGRGRAEAQVAVWLAAAARESRGRGCLVAGQLGCAARSNRLCGEGISAGLLARSSYEVRRNLPRGKGIPFAAKGFRSFCCC